LWKIGQEEVVSVWADGNPEEDPVEAVDLPNVDFPNIL